MPVPGVAAVATEPQPVIQAEEPPPSAPLRLVPRLPQETPSPAPLIVAWLASAVLLACFAAALVIWRDPIMQAWPPSIRLYASLGLR